MITKGFTLAALSGSGLVPALTLMFVLAACSSSHGGSAQGQTHWLASCEDDGDCGELACLCGACVSTCDDADACDVAGVDTECFEATSGSVLAMCAPEHAVALCLEPCDGECGADQACIDGACVNEEIAEMRAGQSGEGGSSSTSDTGGSGGAAGAGGMAGTDATGAVDPPTADTALGLQACPDASAVEWLADFTQPVACAAGVCPMQADGVSALAQGGALIFANDQTGRISPGVASVGLLDAAGALGAFEALPGAPESGQSLGAGTYVAVAADETTSLLYRWQDGELASIEAPGGIVAMAGDDASVAIIGHLAPDLGQRRAWLALYEGAGPELWRIDAPADAVSSSDQTSAAIARDPADQSLSWLVGRVEDDSWRMALVRVDAEGNHLWTSRFDPDAAAQWNTDLDDWLLIPGLAVAGGVTSVAGAVNSAVGRAFDPMLALTFRQYDADGAEIRRWDGLGTDTAPNATPIAADVEGNVYVAWAIRTRLPPGQRLTLLRFGPAGDPCVLADVPDEFPTGLTLRAQDVLFSSTSRLGSVAR